MTYDSSKDTKDHIVRVGSRLTDCADNLYWRAAKHDDSKLHSPEKEAFDEATAQLRGLTYGSQEYKDAFKQGRMPEAIAHHYANNSHHPEHYENGITGMSLLDLIEMLCDWKAASERHADGSFDTSLPINKERFGIDDQLYSVLLNTAREMKLLSEEPT